LPVGASSDGGVVSASGERGSQRERFPERSGSQPGTAPAAHPVLPRHDWKAKTPAGEGWKRRRAWRARQLHHLPAESASSTSTPRVLNRSASF